MREAPPRRENRGSSPPPRQEDNAARGNSRGRSQRTVHEEAAQFRRGPRRQAARQCRNAPVLTDPGSASEDAPRAKLGFTARIRGRSAAAGAGSSRRRRLCAMPASALQRGLLAVSLAAALVVVCALARRRLAEHGEATRARRELLAGLLANVSEGLDRLEAGLDEIARRAAAAKLRLGQLAAARSQRILACAALRERARRRPAPAQPAERRAKPLDG